MRHLCTLLLCVCGVGAIADPLSRTTGANVADVDAKQHCLTSTLFGSNVHHFASFQEEVESFCLQKKLYTHTSIVSVRMQILQHLMTHEKTAPRFYRYFHRLARTTRTIIAVATYDRPAQVARTLQSIKTFATGCDVHVAYDAPTAETLHGYDTVFARFPAATTYLRPHHGGYFATMKKIVDQNATAVVIASDDTVFMRHLDCAAYGTILRLLGGNGREAERVSLQLRISHATRWADWHIKGTPKPAVLTALMNPFTPYVFALECSGNHTMWYHACYNRHIDGPMYLTDTIKEEWSQLKHEPQHPGELEGVWMFMLDEQRNGTVRDVSLFPADQIVVNAGLDLGTVRNDRKDIEDAAFAAAKAQMRANETKLLQDGCFPDFTGALPVFLDTPATHTSIGALAQNMWTCL